MSAPHADRDHSEHPSTATAGSDPTHPGTSRSASARVVRASEAQVEAVRRVITVTDDWKPPMRPEEFARAVADAVVAAGPDADEVARLRGELKRLGHEVAKVARERSAAEDRAERLGSLSEAYREHLEATTADWRHERLRAEAAEAERDEIAGRLSALLCELTGGRLSKTTYDVPTMVAEIDSVYDDAQREERAERDRLAATVEAMLSVCRTTDGDWLDGEAEIPVGEVLRMAAESGHVLPGPATTPGTPHAPAGAPESASGQSGEGEALRGAENGVPSIGDTCCGKCPGGTCYVDRVTGA